MAGELVSNVPQGFWRRIGMLPSSPSQFEGTDRYVVMRDPFGKETLVLAACEKPDGKLWVTEDPAARQVFTAHLMAREGLNVTGSLNINGGFAGVRERDI